MAEFLARFEYGLTFLLEYSRLQPMPDFEPPKSSNASFEKLSPFIIKPKFRYPFKNFDSIPEIFGCYGWYLNNNYLYIGKSSKVRTRVLSHIPRMKRRIPWDLERCEIHIWIARRDDGLDLGMLECLLITKLKPKYNRQTPRIISMICD